MLSSSNLHDNKNLAVKNINDDFSTAPVKQPLPDIAVLEQTMFVFQRVRSVFDFSPPISLISEMRIINKGLSCSYNPLKTHLSTDDEKSVSLEVTNVVQKFSHILPEIEFLLAKIENLPTGSTSVTQAEDIKKQIIFALEKVSYEKNSLTPIEYDQDKDQKNIPNYHISVNIE